MPAHRIVAASLASIYPHYMTTAGRKNRSNDEVVQVIRWLTGYDTAGLHAAIAEQVNLQTFFAQAPGINPNAALITGVICGHRVEQIEDPLLQQIRCLDRLVDEVAKGRR